MLTSVDFLLVVGSGGTKGSRLLGGGASSRNSFQVLEGVVLERGRNPRGLTARGGSYSKRRRLRACRLGGMFP